jgi:uncharacterized integral membrane protein
MWLLRVLIFVALLAILVAVGLQNDGPVDVHFFGKDFLGVPLFAVMFLGALLGLVAGLLLSMVREVKLRMLLSREQRERAVLAREVGELRAAPLQGFDPDRRKSTLPEPTPPDLDQDVS